MRGREVLHAWRAKAARLAAYVVEPSPLYVRFHGMAHGHPIAKTSRPATVNDVAAALSVYPVEAFAFVQGGLEYTVSRIHGGQRPRGSCSHVSGQQLCEGLLQFAQSQWGLLARAVLARWNITSTYDFGRIVFGLIDAGILHKTEHDTIEDFRNVYDFSRLDAAYRFQSKL